MFLKNEVICLKDMGDSEIHDALEVYSKCLRSFFSFKICGFGVSFCEKDEDDTSSSIDENHWVKTVWPLIVDRVVILEFFDTVEFNDDILPTILNQTKNLRILKIHNLQFSPKEELVKIHELSSLEELTLDNLETDNIDNKKLLLILPEKLRKLSLKSMWGSNFIINDITNILKRCSLNLQTLELISIDVTPAFMRSVASIDMKLKKFCLILADSMHYDHDPEVLQPLFQTKWPLKSLTLRADCLNNEHLFDLTNKFKNLEILSISSDSKSNVNDIGIISLGKLKRLKNLYLGFGRDYRAYGAFY